MQSLLHKSNVLYKSSECKSRKRNIFDYIIILTIVSVIFTGDSFGAFTPIVLIGFFASLYLIFNPAIWKKYLLPNCKFILLFFIFLFAYSVLSVLWTTGEKFYVINIILTYCYSFNFLLLLYSILRSNRGADSIITGWLVLTILNLCCSFWEITTGNHFSSGSFNADSLASQGHFRIYSAVTYGNYNSYSIVLCLSLLFILLFMNINNKMRWQVFSIVLLLVIAFVLLVNTSRGSLICFLLFFIPLWYTISHNKKIKYLVFLLLISVIVYIWYEYSDMITVIVEEQLNARPDPNDDPRWELWKAGLDIAAQWWYIGSGPGSMTIEYEKKRLLIIYAHNLWIQMLVEYGLLITLLFFKFYLGIVKKTLFSIDKFLKIMGLYFIFCWPILTIIDEGYFKPVHWIFFASVYSIIVYRKKYFYG